MQVMTFERFDLDIEISDSHVVGYVRAETSALVSLRLWDDSLVDVRFDRLVLLYDCLAGDVADLVRGSLSAQLIEAQHENGGELVEYQFLDTEGRASLCIVCEAGEGSPTVVLRAETPRD